MNSNPIDELRKMQVPVSEQEWESIVHDKRYVKKFGKKPGLSPKGRAALIAGAAAVLVSIPILVKTLSHKANDTAMDNQAVTQVVEPQKEADNNAPTTVSNETQSPAAVQHSEAAPQMLPSASSTTANAATHEQSTLAAVTEARVPSTSRPALTNVSASTPATQPKENIRTTPEKPAIATVTDTKKNRPEVAENRSQTANPSSDDEQPTMEKSSDETEAEVDEFFIPSAFTPNGDGLNDLFLVKANFVPRTFEMSILSRGGDLVFLTRDMDIGWDGQQHGQTLPSGVYVCIIKYTDRQGNIQKKQGQVLLLP